MIWPQILWVVPAYVANPAATLSKFFPRRHPIDFGRRWSDGRRVLGDGKTFEGFIIGTLLGGLAGSLVFPLFGLSYNPWLIAFGALLGDAAASFAKRRIGLPRGAPAPLIDQLDFIFGAFALGGVPSPDAAVLIILITPFLHRAANIIGYVIGVKNEPW